jgi:2'-5' RNA ligase
MRRDFDGEEGEQLERVRCFAAVLLDAAVLEELEVVQRLLKRKLQGGLRWAEPSQMHLTLHFLGDAEAADVGVVGEELGVAARGVAPFELSLDGLGVFPGRGRPRVLWAGLAGGVSALGELQRRISEAVMDYGDHRELKSFQPHITMGRFRPESGLEVDAGFLGSVADGMRKEKWTVREVVLMRSDLHAAGARYTILSTATLG